MDNQLKHDKATRVLRTFVMEQGYTDQFDALDSLLDELKEWRKSAQHLSAELARLQIDYAQQTDTLERLRRQAALDAVKRTAERNR